MIILVLGGARSGKSEVAERLAGRFPLPLTYVATTPPSDESMAARIAAHKARRAPGWDTIEAGLAMPDVLAQVAGSVLVDSLGPWLAAHEDFVVDGEGLCLALRGRKGDTVVVSDEVGLGVHPSTEAGRQFRDALGRLNQVVAEVADDVILVVAGRQIPLEQV